MAYQFQRIGPAGGKGLPSIQVPKLQAGPKLQTGTLLRPQDKPDSKDQLTGALLGMLGPSIGRLGVKGLGALIGEKAPDWMRLEEQDPRVTAEAFDDPAALAKMSLPERETFQKQKELIDQVLPKYKTPARLTGFGQLIEGLGTYLPSFFLDEDSAESYIKGSQASAKRFGDYDDSVLDAALARLQKRGEVMANRPSGEQRKFEGAVVLKGDNKATQVSRTGLSYKDGRNYILSQGDPEIDLDAEGRFVETGQYYSNPQLSSSLRDRQREASKRIGTFVNKENGHSETAYAREVFSEDGLVGTEIFLRRGRRDQDGNYVIEDIALEDLPRDPASQNFNKDGGSNWELYQHRYDLAPPPKDEKESIRERWDQLREYEHSAEQLAYFATKVRGLDPLAFTGTAQLLKTIDSLKTEVKALVSTFGGRSFEETVGTAFTRKAGDEAGLGSPEAIRMYGNLQKFIDAQNKYQPNDPLFVKAQNDFIRAIEAYEAKTEDPSLKGLFSGIGDDFSDVASDAVILKSLQIQMAYMAAATAGQTGRTLSDKDLAFFLQAIGFEASPNPDVIKKSMASFIGDIVSAQPTRDTFTREFIRNPNAVNSYLKDELRISGNLLDRIEDPETKPEDRKALVAAVESEIRDKTGDTRFIRFDPTTNKFKYFGIFEYKEGEKDLIYLSEWVKPGGFLDQEGIKFRPADVIRAASPELQEREADATVRPRTKRTTKPDDFTGY